MSSSDGSVDARGDSAYAAPDHSQGRTLAWRTGAFVAAFVAGLLFHSRYAFDGLAAFDVGILLEGAERIQRAETFGADFFAPYGPLRYYLVAGVMSLMGSSLGHWCWLAVVLQSAACAGLMLVSVRSSGWFLAVLAFGMVSVAHGSFHKCFLAVCAVLVMAVASWVFPAGRPARTGTIVASGAVLGLVFLTRYDAGVFAGIALTVGALLRPGDRIRVPALLGLGACGVVLPIALLLWSAGAEPGEWVALTRQRIAVQEWIPTDYPGFEEWGRTGRRALGIALIAAPLVHTLNLVRAVRSRCGFQQDAFRLAVALFGLALLNQARLLPTANHLFQALPPAFVGLADLCAGPLRRGRWLRRGVMIATAAALTLWVARSSWGVYPAVFSSRLHDAVPYRDPRAGIRLERRELAAYRMMVSEIQELVPEGQALATGPRSAIFCFLADRSPATPYSEPSYYYRNLARQREVLRAWQQSQTPAVVYIEQEPTGYLRFDEDAEELYQGMLRRTSRARRYGPFVVREF